MNTVKEKKSIVYVSRHSELEGWIRDFSAYLKAHPDRNAIIYPEEFATGFAKVYTIEPGLTYRIVDYHLNTDFVFTRESSKRFFIIIYFYQYSNSDHLLFTINGEKVVEASGNYGTLLMTNSSLSQRLEVSKNTDVQGLTIQITDKWLQDKIDRQHTSDYSMFREKKVFQSFITPKSQKLLSDIFAENKSFVPSLYMNTRVLRLLESFFDKLLRENTKNFFPSSTEEAVNILKVKSILLENYQSGFPNIENLARIALMSSTKLKRIFKKSFGMGLYEFYQKNRMHKAKEILDSGAYSISEVGYMVGYKNLSNFSNAFKKEFGSLPKDFKKTG
jgi:AraC-like DNA-binding protein